MQTLLGTGGVLRCAGFAKPVVRR